MTQNRRIVLNIVATYGRSLYALVLGLFCGRWTLMALGQVDYGLMGGGMRRLTYKLHGCALSTETKASVPLISTALPMAVIALHGKDKRFTEPCRRFARALRLDFFPQLVQPATGERYAHPSGQHFPSMGADPIKIKTHRV